MAEANPDLVVRCNGRVQNECLLHSSYPPTLKKEKLRFIWSSIVQGNNSSSSSSNNDNDDNDDNNNKCKCKCKCEAIKLNLKSVPNIFFGYLQ
jgi:hypothetical protein